MIRSSKHILKFQTTNKTNWLDRLFADYKIDLQFYIDKIWSEEMSSKKFDSTFVQPNIILHSQYVQILHKQAVEIVSSQRKKKKKTKPEIKNLTIPIDERLYDIRNSDYFDKFVHLRLPYITKHRAKFIRLPVKEHQQSLKYKNWTRNKTILLQKINGNYYVTFSYEKDDPDLRPTGKTIGGDQGYKKLLITSDGQIIGSDFVPVYLKISRKEQGSQNFKDSLLEGEKFLCTKCGFETDADFNASINISHRGVYSPSTLRWKCYEN